MTSLPPWGIIARMSYEWWVLIHILGVAGFVGAHGVSMAVLFRLRTERDLTRINALLALSSASITPMYIALVVLLTGGIGAAIVGDLWAFGWIWGAIGTLVAVIAVMYGVATGYYKRVRTIADAMAGGSQAVSPEQFDEVLRSSKPLVIAGVGLAGLGFILYLMVVKPSLGMSPSSEPADTGDAIEIVAEGLAFNTDTLEASADQPIVIAFDNRDVGTPHNISIYADQVADVVYFVGETFPGPAVRLYEVGPIGQGSVFFRCDVHPDSMTGTLVVR